MEGMKAKPGRPIVTDPMLIQRIKKYLEENVHHAYVDVNVMARQLQERYQDYGRRKQRPFRFLVDQAYKIVLHSYGLNSNPTSEDESDIELMEDTPAQGNQMNNMLNAMYRSNPPATPNANAAPNKESTSQNDFAIDISSDDSEADETDEIGAEVAQNLKSKLMERSASADDEIDNIFDTNKLAGSPVPLTKKRKIDGAPFDSVAKQKAPRPKKFKVEFAAQKSDYTFKDIGGNDSILIGICRLLLHMKLSRSNKTARLPTSRGILLHGPPGVGKTLFAKAIAGQLKIGLFNVSGTELISGVSGESEERIRDLFEQAAMAAPCVLFIDEIETISGNRQNAQKDMERRIVSQLISSLDELASVEKGDQVIVIGATNRADTLDPSLRRAGRFDQEISLGFPDREARGHILRIFCNELNLGADFDYDAIAALTPGFVGSDLMALATCARNLANERYLHQKEEIALNSAASGAAKPANNGPVSSDANDTHMQIDGEVAAAAAIPEPNDTEAVAATPNADTEPSTNSDADAKTDVPEEHEPKIADEQPANDIQADAAASNDEDGMADDEMVGHSSSSNGIDDTTKSTNLNGNDEAAPAAPPTDSQRNALTRDVLEKWLSDASALIVTEDDVAIRMGDFQEAVKLVQPSAKREGFITVPDVTWDDIGSLRDIRKELNLAITAPVKYPKQFKALGMKAPAGVLLCGPPGCGKTLLAKAIANEAGINFISVKGPELLNMYVGESERAVRLCFQRARNSAPCVIFFDEFDSLCPQRSSTGDGNAGARVVNQLLTEMDGVEGRKGVFIMAATNRPDMIDAAVLRPGRLDKILYVDLPKEQDRYEILQAQTKNGKEPALAEDVDLMEIAGLTDSFTGADLAGLIQEANLIVLDDFMLAAADTSDNATSTDIELKVSKRHLTAALQKIRPSVSNEDKQRYEKLRLQYAPKQRV